MMTHMLIDEWEDIQVYILTHVRICILSSCRSTNESTYNVELIPIGQKDKGKSINRHADR